MVTVKSADLRRQFTRYRELALREPVSVTHKALDTREALYAWELPQDLARALETAEPPAFTAKFDNEMEA